MQIVENWNKKSNPVSKPSSHPQTTTSRLLGRCVHFLSLLELAFFYSLPELKTSKPQTQEQMTKVCQQKHQTMIPQPNYLHLEICENSSWETE